MEKEEQRSVEDTPTWAVSVVCFFLLVISLLIEAALHKLTEFLRKRKRKSLGKGLAKTKKEMMKFGFISFLLAISSEVPLSKICVNKAVANSFLPCADSWDEYSEEEEPASASANEVNYCEAKGMVGLISSEGIEQLNIFISVLAVFHILYCTLTMGLGMAKMRRWKRWEDETQTLEYRIAHDSSRFQYTGQTSVGKRHLKFWSNHSPLLWMVCFFRQFYGSVSKDDYFTLRNGFIAANISVGSNFNFMKFLSRTYDEDFEKIVTIRAWIWIFSLLFIFLSAHDFYNHYWLPFIPLVVALLAGTKLQVIITKMCVDSCKERPVIKGTLLVGPSDDYFWFGRPEWLLHLLQLILIQNSFQLAFFAWTWFEFGPRSCFNREIREIAIRIVMGVAVQLLCGYVTLPLYALVTQMGSGMRSAVFTERVAQGLKNWHKKAKQSLSTNNSTSSNYLASLHSKKSDYSARGGGGEGCSISLHSNKSDNNNSARGSVENNNMHTPDNINEDLQLNIGEDEGEKTEHSCEAQDQRTDHSTSEISIVEEESHKIISKGSSFNGEISFGSSWKNMDSSRGIGEINSINEEEEDNNETYVLPEMVPYP